MKKIFFALRPDLFNSKVPQSAKRYIPEWYKKAELYMGKSLIGKDGQNKKTIKACSPFMDAFMSGYIFESPTDIYITKDENGYPFFKWALDTIELFATRSQENLQGMPSPEGFFEIALTFKHPLYIKTPPGYSVLITQPLNRFDLPIQFMSGVVDTDIAPLFPGNYPCYVKEDFEGIVPAGTPLFQIIPIKRELWKSEDNKDIVIEGNKAMFGTATKFVGWYKQNVWQKKSYE